MLPDAVDKSMRILCGSLSRTAIIEAVYVYGSTALGDYIVGSSDIDFVAIVRGPLTPSHVQSIKEAHEEVERARPDSNLMGAYILREDAGKPVNEMTTLLAYYEKQVYTDGKGADLNPVTWWILKYYGIRVYGPEVPFAYGITTDSLIRYVIGNMNTYWASWVNRLEQQLASSSITEQDIRVELLDYAVEWCVLGMLRQMYTIKEHNVISKTGAGAYGLKVLSNRWHGLVQEAVAIKRREPTRVYRSQLKRLSDLVDLLRLIMEESNRH